MEAAVRLVNEAGLSYGFVQQSGPRNHWFSLSAIARAACEPLRVRTSVFGLSGFGLLGHGVFSFSAPLSRAPKAGGTRLPDAALAGEPRQSLRRQGAGLSPICRARERGAGKETEPSAKEKRADRWQKEARPVGVGLVSLRGEERRSSRWPLTRQPVVTYSPK
jgi:hypothetical protein